MGSGENLPSVESKSPSFNLKIMENYFSIHPDSQLEVIDNYFSSTPTTQLSDSLTNKFISPKEVKKEASQIHRLSPPQKPGRLKRLSRKILPWLQRTGNKLLNLLRHYASWIGFLQTLTSFLLEKIPALVLRITDYISPVGRTINGLKLVHHTLFHRKGNWTRRLSLLAGLGSVGLGIAALLVPPLGLIFATANIANNTFLSLWVVAISIKKKLALRNTWQTYELRLRSTLPASGPLRNSLYVEFKNGALKYRVSTVERELSLSVPELIKNLGAARTHLLIAALNKSQLSGNLDELYPFQKDLLKITAKKRHIPRKNIRTQIEEDEKEFYNELSEPLKLKKYLRFKNKDPSTYQDETNIKLSELEQRILKSKNQERKLNAQLATQIYNAGIMFLALTGIIMSFFTPTIIVGASILLATSIHGILLGYDLSGKWPQRVQNYFFGPLTADSEDELKKKQAAYKKQYSSTAATELTLRSNNRSSEPQVKLKPNEQLLLPIPQKTSTEQNQLPSTTPSFWQKFLSKQSEQSSPMPPTTYLDIMPTH